MGQLLGHDKSNRITLTILLQSTIFNLMANQNVGWAMDILFPPLEIVGRPALCPPTVNAYDTLVTIFSRNCNIVRLNSLRQALI